MINTTNFSAVTTTNSANVGAVRKATASSAEQSEVYEASTKRTQGREFEAAIAERNSLSYDEPGKRQQSAIGQYGQVANFARRDEIQKMVGVDIYV